MRQWYQPHLEQRYPDAQVRAGDLDQLQRIAVGYPSRAQFLTDLTLDPPSATSDEAGAPLLDEDYLILSTIHSAKGQEWKAVYVLNVVDGCIPSDMATGNSRGDRGGAPSALRGHDAGEGHLLLVVPQRFYVHAQAKRGDRHVYAARTRFIPAQIAGHFDAAVLAGGQARLARRRTANGSHRRSRSPHARHVAQHRHMNSKQPAFRPCLRKTEKVANRRIGGVPVRRVDGGALPG